MKLMVTGGGTGGHIYPALSIADAFRRNMAECEVVYVGTEKGMESGVVPVYGYRFLSIDVSGFRRNLSVENLRRGWKAAYALMKVRKMIKEEKPDLVIGTGGYVCGPVVMTAAMMGIPTAIHEQNVFPGITNKMLHRFVDYVFLGFEKAEPRFHKAKKIIYCGNPIRTEKFNITKEEARKRLGIPEKMQMIFSMGGSGGSTSLNQAIAGMMPQLVIKGIAIVHVSGKLHYNEMMDKLKSMKESKYHQVKPYIDDIAEYMAAADIIIGSAGATSLAEINYLGKASIIVPKAYTAENHQEYNAKMIEDAGAGYCILEKDLTADLLREKVYSVLEDESCRFQMEKKSKALSKENPEDILWDYLKDVLKTDYPERTKEPADES